MESEGRLSERLRAPEPRCHKAINVKARQRCPAKSALPLGLRAVAGWLAACCRDRSSQPSHAARDLDPCQCSESDTPGEV